METKIYKGTILLTAAGFYNPEVIKIVTDTIDQPKDNKVAIITTASRNKENDPYAQLAKSQFQEMGFDNVDFIDLETDDLSAISNYSVIYVCGGNTFKLLKFAKESNFKSIISDLLDCSGLYIGVSAGSLIVAPSIEIATTADKNEIGLTDFSGLNIVDVTIFPHYEEKHESMIKDFETRTNTTINRLTNNQALLIKDGNINLIG